MRNLYPFTYSMPSLMGIKNADSIYVQMTDQTAQLLGWKNGDACLGKTDYDIPCDAFQFAKTFIEQDKKVIQSQKTMLILDVHRYKTGTKILLGSKTYLESNEVLINSIDISDCIIFQNYIKLIQMDSKFTHKHGAASYILNADHCPLPLTEKQKNCLFLLIRGKTIKEIAAILNLSPRTVEDHIKTIKNKFQCNSKGQVIEKAIHEGFLFYVPDHFQKKALLNIS